MTEDETMLLAVFSQITDAQSRAILLQSFIAENGPLTEEAGAEIRRMLANANRTKIC